MNYLRMLPFLCIALSLITAVAQAADEDAYLGQIQPPSEQTMGQGQSALWTLPHAATQYQPINPTPAMQAALQAQHEGRFLEALILLEKAGKGGSANAGDEMDLLRASFLLQGNQSRQAVGILAPLLGKIQHAADAYALTAMALLQQGQMREALEAAQHAHDPSKHGQDAQNLRSGMLQHLALSYVLQGAGRLAEAHEVMHGFNAHTPQQAIALAREAELALTLDQIQSAKTLTAQARAVEMHPYVIAVSGLVYLIDGQIPEAKAAFETALQRDPKDAKALLGLGLAEIKLGNSQAGQKKLQAANDADPGNALILTYLGRSQQQDGQTGAARANWRSAQLADPKDPTPWLYQAQAELQANRPLDARESLRQAQARMEYRKVYRGERLLREDLQLLQANFAEIQRRLGLDSLAFHTLSVSPGASNTANLRNQADVLQGRRFGESARRSLLLQSLFNEKPGNLPSELDLYGDGAGQTGATTPQHGAVSSLGAQQASYNNYDELFNQRTTLEADAVTGSKNTNGEQVRLGVGNDTLGLGLALRQFKTDGFAPFEYLDNSIGQATVQWLPTSSTQAFVSHQRFNSRHGETFFPAFFFGYFAAVEDVSRVTRAGLRHSLTDDDELRGLWSTQQTAQVNNNTDFFVPPNLFSQSGSSSAHSEELQYRRSGADYATQWGIQYSRGQVIYRDAAGVSFSDYSKVGRQVYATWQQTLNPFWQLEAGLIWGKLGSHDNMPGGTNTTSLARWLPRLGAVYAPDSRTHLRLAAWQGMGVYGVGDASLAPATLAGVLLTRSDDDGKLVKAVSVGGDKQLSTAWLLAAETQRRRAEDPVIFTAPLQELLRQQVDESRLALHWQPQDKQWTVSLIFDDERLQYDSRAFAKDNVNEQHLRAQQLIMHWFTGAQCTVDLLWSHNRVGGTQRSLDLITFNPIFPAYQDGFNQVDASLSWQFNGSGLLTAGVRNAADVRFQYTEIDKLNPRFSNGRLMYAKLKFAW